MYYLLASIFFTAITYSIFRAFPIYGVHPLSAILINYLVRLLAGLIISPQKIFSYVENAPLPLLGLAAITGIVFVAVFSFVSYATRVMGVAATTIIARMSMVIPTCYSIIVYHEALGPLKIVGICLAILAIILTVYKPAKDTKAKISGLAVFIPVLLFIGAGLADVFLKISQMKYMPQSPDLEYIDVIFFFSSMACIIALAIQKTPVKTIFKRQNILWGGLLGIINYAALLLFLMALSSGNMPGSQVFPINSTGIVLGATILAVLIYKEKIGWNKIGGLLLAVCAILLISKG